MSKKLLKKILPQSVQKKFRILNYVAGNKLTYAEDCLYTTINADFLKEPNFIRSYALGKSLMQDSWGDYDFRWRAFIVAWAAKHAKDLEGDFVECGVNTGMNARMIIDYIHFENVPKIYHLLDTFSGMDEKYSTKEEMMRSKKMGYVSDIYESVKETFKEFKNVNIIKGPIPETLAQVSSEKISLLLIDMNCVMPEVDALEFFWDKMTHGGIIILDDHGFPGHGAQRQAHNEFASRKNITILPLPTGQGLIIKQ